MPEAEAMSKSQKYQRAYSQKYTRTVRGRAKHLFLGARRRARSKSLAFDLTEEWVRKRLSPLKCELTGMELMLVHGTDHSYKRQHPRTPSLDRIDSSKGYTRDNCRIVSAQANLALSAFGESAYRRMALAYIAHNGLEPEIPKRTLN